MPSLPLDVYPPSRKNFHDEVLEYSDTELRYLKVDGTFVPWFLGPVQHRDYVLDIYQGREIPNFHRRRNSGELLPMTYYRFCKGSLDWHGPAEHSVVFVDSSANNRNSQLRWADGSTKVLPPQGLSLSPAKFTKVNQLVEDLGIDPFFYVQQAASKIYSRGWDSLTFLAELHLTIRMFRNVVLNFAKLVDAWFQTRTTAGQFAEAHFNTWLEGRYGWRILLYDIQDIKELVKGLQEDQLTRVKDRAGINSSLVQDDSYTMNYNYWRIEVLDTTQFHVKVRGRIIADFVPPLILNNIVTSGWELTRYSFVLDWIISFGQFLNALSFLATNSTYTAASGIEVVALRQASVSTFANPGSTLISSTYDDFGLTENWTARIRDPRYIPTNPKLHLNLNEFKIFDLIALIGQIVTKLT